MWGHSLINGQDEFPIILLNATNFLSIMTCPHRRSPGSLRLWRKRIEETKKPLVRFESLEVGLLKQFKQSFLCCLGLKPIG